MNAKEVHPNTAGRSGGVPPAEDCVLRYLMQRRAAECGSKVFYLAPDGREWTYAEFHRNVSGVAHALRRLGVRQGDHVLSWLPNGTDALRVWFGLNYLGAVYVPVNTAYRGSLLEHVVANSDARLLIAHGQLVSRLAEIRLAQLDQVVTIGDVACAIAGLKSHGAKVLEDEGKEPPELERPLHPWDTQAIIYTSGTTGPSKGVLLSYMHLFTNSGIEAYPYVTHKDRFLVTLPLFHVAGASFVFAMMIRAASFALVDSFRTDDFWKIVDRTRSTATLLLGVMTQFLLKQPPASDDRSHCLRTALLMPLSEENAAFRTRFATDIFTCFNMTETTVPVLSALNPTNVASCGRVRSHVEVRLVDANDIEVPPGSVGEMIVRSHAPWALNHGYQKNPEATAAAWRNGWFHTGDAFRVDADGCYYFVDRIKDAIRRRGENVSSYEVEAEAGRFHAIKEAAAVAVPGEYGEDEILLVVSPKADVSINPVELLHFLKDRLAYFMLPRYLRIMTELPKTPTLKVQKVLLRQQGVTADTFDRQSRPDLTVKREKFQSSAH